MSALLLTCESTTRLLTDFLEGGLALPRRLQVRAHLAICPGCRAFFASLRQVPERLKRLLPPEPPARSSLEGLLKGAMSRIAAGEIPHGQHPDADWFGKAHLAPLLAAHLARCPGCASAHPDVAPAAGTAQDPLGPALRASLPPEAQWKRHTFGLRGAASTTLREDASGALYLIHLPAGRRFPIHTHVGTERAVLLDGLLDDGGQRLFAGSVKTYAPGDVHAPLAIEDCWVLAHLEGEVHFSGWRSLFS